MTGIVRGDFTIRDEELPIRTDSEAFKLITRVQDEAHRFCHRVSPKTSGAGAGSLDSG